jgi:DNA recombination protein RmuC
VANLARKDYHTLYRLRSLDFVVMFIPVEPAFMLAIAEDAKLWQEAYAKNVLLVSPTTLLFVIRTVANLWRQEKQTRNVDEIMRRGVALYDKVVGFVTELEKVGERIRQAGESYDTALQRLKTGPGSVIRQVELLRKLGVKPTRTLPASVVEEQLSLLDEDEDEPLLEEESGEVETGIRD